MLNKKGLKPMKKILFCTSLFVITNSAMANAAPTSDLTVSGTVVAPSCTVSATESGIYDFGAISPALIGKVEKALTPINQTYTIHCDAITYLTFKTIDNRSDSVTVPSDAKFGLGKNGERGNVGYYTGKVKNAMVDGAASKLMQSASTSFYAYDVVDLTNSTTLVTGWAEANSKLKSGTDFQADVEITPYLSKSSDFGGVVSNVDLNGSARSG